MTKTQYISYGAAGEVGSMTATTPISPVATCKERFRFRSSERAKSVADWAQFNIAEIRRWGSLQSNAFTVEVIWNDTLVELWETAVCEQNNESYRKCLSDAFIGAGAEVLK